jgi:hypothetical protein
MSEQSDRSPSRSKHDDLFKEKQKRLLQMINYQSQMDKGNTGGIQLLMNSYNLLINLSSRFHLKLNVIPTLFGSFEPRPVYLRTDPITERVVSSVVPQDQVRAFIDMCHEYNVKR